MSALDAAQLVTALRVEGPLREHHLKSVLGAYFWVPGRYDAALATARARGWVVVTEDGRLRVA